MKTSQSSMTDRPRLACRVVQGWAAVAGDGAAPRAGAWGARHVAACEDCGRFFARGDALETSLRRGAMALSAEAVPGLEQRINDAVARSVRMGTAVPPSREGFSGFAMGSWALAGAAASVAVALLVSQQMKSPRDAGRPEGLVTAPVPAGTVAGDGLLDGLSPDATALLQGEPLRREVDAMYSDARSALGFLALNFLPKSPDEAGVGVMASPSPRPAGG